MSSPNQLLPPKKDSKDLLRQLVKSTLAILSFGTASEFFDLVVKEPAEERLEKWAEEVTEAIQTLIARGEIDPESLFSSEAFRTTLVTTTREAIATHQQETIDALRNAVLNSALPDAPDDNQQKMFIQWASELTPWHIKLLMLFGKQEVRIPSLNLNIADWRMFNTVDELADVIEATYPEMTGCYQVYLQMIHDLHQRGFLVHEIPARDMLSRIDERPVLSPVARAFLKFITSPLDKTSKQ